MADNNDDAVLFEDIFCKPVLSQFDSKLRSSNGGASLLGAIDRRIKLTEGLCSHLIDKRAPGRVDHSYLELLRLRPNTRPSSRGWRWGEWADLGLIRPPHPQGPPASAHWAGTPRGRRGACSNGDASIS